MSDYAKPALGRQIEVVPNITLDLLLSGYDSQPFLDNVYTMPTPGPTIEWVDDLGAKHTRVPDVTGEATSSILDIINSYFGTHFDETTLPAISEGVLNIDQHCLALGKKARVILYSTPEKDRFIGLFQLDTPCCFKSQEMEDYLLILQKTSRLISEGKKPGEIIMHDSDFDLGTYLSMSGGNVSRVGFADIEGESFYFFEYNL